MLDSLVTKPDSPYSFHLKNSFHFSEPYVESLPQVHIIMSLIAILRPDRLSKITGDDWILLLITFLTSVFSSTFGITKFLIKSPLKLLPNEGRCGGYLQCSFLLAFISVFLCLCAKAHWLAMIAGRSESKTIAFGLWIGCSILPQTVLVLGQMVYHFGCAETWNFLIRWPGIILTSTFSSFTFAGQNRNGQKVLVISKKYTLINLLVTTMGMVSGITIWSFLVPKVGGNTAPEVNLKIVISVVLGSNLLCMFFILVISILLFKCSCACCDLKIHKTCINPKQMNETLDFVEVVPETVKLKKLPTKSDSSFRCEYHLF